MWCKVLVWMLMAALVLPPSLTGCVSRNRDYRADAPTSGLSRNRAPSPALAENTAGASSSRRDAAREENSRPRGLNEALFNTVASFMGLPGLAPQRGVDGSLDEGLGFHQDGTTRRAGSDNDFDGQRARAYQRAGLGTGPGAGMAGLNGLAPSYGDERTAALWHDVDYSGRRDARNGSRSLDSLNPFDMAVERGLNYGMGLLNSAGEAALSGLTDNGRARLNFQMNKDGRLSGEGDVLLPLYDGRYTTLFTQLGARSMDVNGGEDDGSQRWIGNFGLGQRWFPLAESLDDAGNLMLGYNVFFDNDFTRSHQRGGAGVEAQYDWFHVAANYYTPLSGWKASRDFDGDFVEERPARGWDARLKAYLPFYRNVALTGAYAQWYGDHVAMYGSSDDLEKDPKVWSYGVEYTPVPLVSGFVKQRSTERGKTDTEFGLQFTYHFGMPWDEQVSHAKVAELRSVSGSRHEFVDRENRIILEYRAKNAYMIEYLGPNGGAVNEFVFRIRNGFDEYKAGQTVHVTASGVTLAAAPAPPETSLLARLGGAIADFFSTPTAHAADFSQSYTTDGQGRFIVRIGSSFAGPVALRIQAGDNSQSFTVNVVANMSWELDAASATLTQGTAGNLTLTLTRGGVAQSGITVAFTPNPNIQGLPASRITNSSGQITLTGLVALTSTNQTVTATVDGNNLKIPVTVIPGTYTLEASPPTLAQHLATNVTFTVKVNNTPVPAGTSVTFAANSNFTNLPAGAQTTNASGQIVLNGLTALVSGSQAVSATVDGQTVSADITVTAAGYAIEANPSTLTQRLATNVTFTVKRNGAAVSAGTPVKFAANANFMELASPVTRTTDASGQVSLDLTATASGSQTVSATVDSQLVSANFTVAMATPVYTLPNAITVSTNNSPADGATANVVQVQVYDSANLVNAGAGVTVTWSVTNPSPATDITLVGGNTSTTNASGVAEMRITDNGDNARSVTVQAAVDGGGAGKEQSKSVNFVAATYSLVAKGVTGAGSGTSFSSRQTAEITVELQRNGVAVSTPPTITWSLDGSTNSSPAVVTSHKAANTYYGLAWGGSASGSPGTELSGNAPATGTSVQLTDIMGERSIRVKAETTVDGTPYSVTQIVTFGDGPLAKMRLPDSSPGEVPTSTGWDNAVNLCGGTAVNADLITSAGYINASNLPEVNDLQAALGGGNSAYLAAGWRQSISYWSGNASPFMSGTARYASSTGGSGDRPATNSGTAFMCRRN